jgi:hypothetical protein
VARFLQSAEFSGDPGESCIDGSVGREVLCAGRRYTGTEIDIVDVFRKSEFMPEVVADALKKRPRCIWMQEGVQHQEAAKTAEAAGVQGGDGPLHSERISPTAAEVLGNGRADS